MQGLKNVTFLTNYRKEKEKVNSGQQRCRCLTIKWFNFNLAHCVYCRHDIEAYLCNKLEHDVYRLSILIRLWGLY